MTVAMLIFGVLTVLAAAGVVFSQKSINSALCLVLTLFLIAVHYALLGADFVAVLQVMIYAGAIMVLVIFVIMLLGLNEKGEKGRLGLTAFLSALTAGVFIALLMYTTKFPSLLPEHVSSTAEKFSGSPQAVGAVLFTKFLYPFEIVSLLLLAAIIAAVVLTYEPKRALPQGRGLKAKQS